MLKCASIFLIQVTDLCDILAEHGKPIILDCSVYPEAKDKILEAVNQGKDPHSALNSSSYTLSRHILGGGGGGGQL